MVGADEQLEGLVQLHILQLQRKHPLAVADRPLHFLGHPVGILGIVGQQQQKTGAIFNGPVDHFRIIFPHGNVPRGHPGLDTILLQNAVDAVRRFLVFRAVADKYVSHSCHLNMLCISCFMRVFLFPL